MEKHTLVTHKYLNSLGIGVISEKLKNSFRVRFGEKDYRKFKINELSPVDISSCKKITYSEWKSKPEKICSKTKYVITDNHLQRFNGIGWIFERSINWDDLKNYEVVIPNATVAPESK